MHLPRSAVKLLDRGITAGRLSKRSDAAVNAKERGGGKKSQRESGARIRKDIIMNSINKDGGGASAAVKRAVLPLRVGCKREREETKN